MENIIYNELRYRGYNVDVGVVEFREKTAEGKDTRKQVEIDSQLIKAVSDTMFNLHTIFPMKKNGSRKPVLSKN